MQAGKTKSIVAHLQTRGFAAEEGVLTGMVTG
jgi:hypothetical protein